MEIQRGVNFTDLDNLCEKYEIFEEMLDMIGLIVIDIFENNLPVSYRENSPKSSESGLAVSSDRMSGFRIHF
jgi:hypothetical protein